jgi:hypothetical protein
VTGVTDDTVALAYLMRRHEKARERLFAAGWKSTMAYEYPQREEFHDLLLALNAAGAAVGRRRLAKS